MKRLTVCLALCLALLAGHGYAATLTVDGQALDTSACRIYQNTTYVPLRAVTEAMCPGVSVWWTGSCAAASAPGLSLTARPGAVYIEANGRALHVPGGVRLENGVTLVPVRVLAETLGACVDWDAATGAVTVTGNTRTFLSGAERYDAGELYWLSRIISSESRGEPFLGQLAVGGVILNRVASAEFPNTVYGVIFDSRWGGQFEPVRNGTVYQEPAAESVIAAKLCLEGVNNAGGSLYFLGREVCKHLSEAFREDLLGSEGQERIAEINGRIRKLIHIVLNVLRIRSNDGAVVMVDCVRKFVSFVRDAGIEDKLYSVFD